MKIRVKDLKNINKVGVYAIVNLKNNKCYIGSTSISFLKRLNIHLMRIKNNNHENKYLNHAYNKDSDFFEFRILIVTKDNLKWEQRALDLFKPFKHRGYNINTLASCPPSVLSNHTINKRSKTFKCTINKAMEYYRLLKDNKITELEIPEKYRTLAISYINKKVWNKGIKYNSTDHLKVPKKNKGDRSNFKKTMLERSFKVEMFDEKMNSLGIWNNTYELIEYSKINKLPINSRFNKERMGKPLNELQYNGIRKSARTNTPYKGLYFKFLEPS